MANFLSFDVYDIDFLKVMNDSNLNFVLLQTTRKFIIIMENLDRFLTEKSMTVSLFVDVHIHFPLYDFLAFKTLANSYLEFKDHKFFSQVEGIFQSGGELELGRDQRADDCKSKLVESGYKIGHHGANEQ
jgi:chaperone BCS1